MIRSFRDKAMALLFEGRRTSRLPTEIQALRVPPHRIGTILQGRRTITADMALRLASHFGTSAEFWLNLQMDYDLHPARRNKEESIKEESIKEESIREEVWPRAA